MVLEVNKHIVNYLYYRNDQHTLKNQFEFVNRLLPAEDWYGRWYYNDKGNIYLGDRKQLLEELNRPVDLQNVKKVYFSSQSKFPRTRLSIVDDIKRTIKLDNAEAIVADCWLVTGAPSGRNNSQYVLYSAEVDQFYVVSLPLEKMDIPTTIEEVISTLLPEDAKIIHTGKLLYIDEDTTVLVNSTLPIINSIDLDRYLASNLPDLTPDMLESIEQMCISSDYSTQEMALKSLMSFNIYKSLYPIITLLHEVKGRIEYCDYTSSTAFTYFMKCIGFHNFHDFLTTYQLYDVYTRVTQTIELELDDFDYMRNYMIDYLTNCVNSFVQQHRKEINTFNINLKLDVS